jgi:hypothetical protein
LYTDKGEPVRQVGQLKSDSVYVAAVGKFERADYGHGLPPPQLPVGERHDTVNHIQKNTGGGIEDTQYYVCFTENINSRAGVNAKSTVKHGGASAPGR